MSRISANINAANLIISILSYIPKHKKVTVGQIREFLAQRGYQRSARTIQRYMEDICEHYDIECDNQNKPYGYRWKANAIGINLPMLSPQESLLLEMAYQHLRLVLPNKVLSSMEPYFEEAKYNLSYAESGKKANSWLKKFGIVPVAQSLIPAVFSQNIWKIVSDSLYENTWIELSYRNQQGGQSELMIMPLALVQQGPSLYLVGKCQGYEDIRHYAIHRIQGAKATNLVFKRPKDFSLDQHIGDARFGFGYGEKIILEFAIKKTAGFHLTETPLSKDQITLEETPDSYRFRATVVQSDMLEWWLAKFKDNIWDITRTPIDG